MFTISDLREEPGFAMTVAGRLWRAWWQAHGASFEDVLERVRESLTGGAIPTTLVAHDGAGRFLGTASLIACDMEQRPDYAPWIAAVWVEPEHRSGGIGSALVTAGADVAFKAGAARAYLCAEPHNVAFYERLSWRQIEADVDGLDILALESSRE